MRGPFKTTYSEAINNRGPKGPGLSFWLCVARKPPDPTTAPIDGGSLYNIAHSGPAGRVRDRGQQNLNLVPAPVLKLVLPLINSGAVVAREPNVADTFKLPGHAIEEAIRLPPLGATMDDCCRIVELLLGGPPSGDTGLTVGILTIVSLVELSVSAVYTANPLTGDGISIDVEYIRSLRLGLRGPGLTPNRRDSRAGDHPEGRPRALLGPMLSRG